MSIVPSVKFGVFEAKLDSAELYKQGRLVRLQHQPFEVLRLLLEQPGEVVTRETIRQHLWPAGVTVEFEPSLNKSITKLRDALGDTATNPRFIETLPKRGYRFIAPIAPQAAEAVPPRHSSIWWVPIVVLIPVAVGVMWLLAAGSSATRVEARVPAASSKPATSSPIFAAKDAYDRGQVALARRSPESLRVSVEHFTRAVTLSPRFAGAYVGLADAWSLLSSYGQVDPREGMPRARDAANRALTLDPTIARAHASLGRIAMVFDWDWPTAEWHLTRAISLDRGDATTHQWYAYFLSAAGRHTEAIDEARRAIAAEPLSLNANTALGYVLYLARRYDEAAAQLERTLEIDPDFAQARRNLALVHVQQGKMAIALAGFERVAALSQNASASLAHLAWLRGLSGQRDEAHKLAAHLDRSRTASYVPADAFALVALGLGARDEALAWLQRAATLRVATVAHLAVDPVWDPLRDDQRLKDVIATIRRE